MERFLVFLGLLVLGFIAILIGASNKTKAKAHRLEEEKRFNKELNKIIKSKK